jgi:ABC-2 type transport system permease protein
VALCLGLLISTLTKSQLVANQMAILMTYLPTLLLSNFVFPKENMPAILKLVTYIVPATYYIDILNGLYLRNLNFAYLWPSFLVLFLMLLFLSTINMLILKKEGL